MVSSGGISVAGKEDDGIMDVQELAVRTLVGCTRGYMRDENKKGATE